MSGDLALRVAEALLFAAAGPLDVATVQAHLPPGSDAVHVLHALEASCSERGVRLERHGRLWAMRTAPDLAPYLARQTTQPRRLSRAALETLAIVAYQQPVTRAEIEAVRGVAVNRGTLDQLVEAGWVQPKGRREVPGRPVTWVTTVAFLDHFDLAELDDLPRLDELAAADLFQVADAAVVADEDAP